MDKETVLRVKDTMTMHLFGSIKGAGNPSKYWMGEGDKVALIDPSNRSATVYLKLEKMQNSLCPSVYNSQIKCFWGGDLTANFIVYQRDGTVLKRFKLNVTTSQSRTLPRTLTLLHQTKEMKFYARKTDKYDPGETSEDARIEVEVSYEMS